MDRIALSNSCPSMTEWINRLQNHSVFDLHIWTHLRRLFNCNFVILKAYFYKVTGYIERNKNKNLGANSL